MSQWRQDPTFCVSGCLEGSAEVRLQQLQMHAPAFAQPLSQHTARGPERRVPHGFGQERYDEISEAILRGVRSKLLRADAMLRWQLIGMLWKVSRGSTIAGVVDR